MLILIAAILTLITAIAILYPFLRRTDSNRASPFLDDSESKKLSMQLESAISGLKTTELEHSIGTLSKSDYDELHREYMMEAAMVMKDMELEDKQKADLIENIEKQIKHLRDSILGVENDVEP